VAEDAREVLDDFILTHSETDYLSSYPDEINITVEKEAEFLRARTESPDEAELIAVVDGNETASIFAKKGVIALYGDHPL
jgi:hypothetical protein